MKMLKTLIFTSLLFLGGQVLALDLVKATTAANVDSAASRGATYADFNGDGNLDVYVANRNQQNQLWLSDGAGDFTSNDIAGDIGFTHAAYSGDVDGDGDIDIYAINLGGGAQNKLWINDGAGNFADNDILGDANNAYGGAVGDVDGDGDLDLYVTILGAQNKLWINDGAGNFADNDIATDLGNSADAVFADVDGDGDNDLYTGNFGQNKLWINDGAGNFTDNDIALDTGNAYGVAAGDVDGDGDIDLYAANDGSTQNNLWINDGSANFTNADIAGDISVARKALFGDLDFDGDVDLYVASNGQNKLWINDGTGLFTAEENVAIPLFMQGVSGDEAYAHARRVMDGDGLKNAVIVDPSGPAILVSALPFAKIDRDGKIYICKDPRALNYTLTKLGEHSDDACDFGEDVVVDDLNASSRCAQDQLVNQDLRKGARDGLYHLFTGGIVSQVATIQRHINRILETRFDNAAGPIDGVFGPKTQLGVERLQSLLNDVIKPAPGLDIDGIIGESTRSAINASCPAVEV